MRGWLVLGTVAGVVLAGAVSGAAQAKAQDGGAWRAASPEAQAITGDIAISNGKVTIDYYTFVSAAIRSLKPAEVSAAFDADVNAGISGELYRVTVPAEQRFQHKNTLCGSDETQWMATYVTGKTLQVTFFSGDDMPVFTFGAIQNSSAVCGTYTYTR